MYHPVQKVSHLLLLIFLRGHHFHVHLGDVCSAVRQKENGVQQGSAISVTLFAAVTSGMVSAVCASQLKFCI
jgi:hypothetical protein